MAPQRKTAQKPTPPAKAGVSANKSTRAATKAREEQLRSQLQNLQRQHEKSSGPRQAEIENQIRVLEQNLDDVMDLDDSGTGADQTDIGSTSGVASENADVNADASSSTNVGTSSNANGSANNAAPAGAHAVEHDRASRRDDGGLFVANHGEAHRPTYEGTNPVQADTPIASTETADGANERTIGLLTNEFGHMSLGRGLGTLETFFKGFFARTYGVYRHGYDDAPTYSVQYFGKGKPRDGSLAFESKSILESREPTVPMYQIRGVAWRDRKGHSHMSSLSEDNWEKVKKQMFVKVRWENETGEESWEGLRAFKKYAFPGGDDLTIPTHAPIVYRGITLLREGDRRHPSEIDALKAAVGWQLLADAAAKNNGRRPADRSSPGVLEQPQANGNSQVNDEEEL